MTNRIALVLALIIVMALITDWWLYGDQHFIFLGKKMLDLIDWVAFWR